MADEGPRGHGGAARGLLEAFVADDHESAAELTYCLADDHQLLADNDASHPGTKYPWNDSVH